MIEGSGIVFKPPKKRRTWATPKASEVRGHIKISIALF